MALFSNIAFPFLGLLLPVCPAKEQGNVGKNTSKTLNTLFTDRFMYVAHSLDEIPSLPSPIALTIGNFDGVHAGHQYLLKQLGTLGTPAVFTFSNHSREFLTGQPMTKLTSLESRLTLLEKAGVALTILLPFTQEFASQSYTTFLTLLHSALPFTHLLLGEDAALGHNREGTPNRLTTLGTTLGFAAHFLPKLTEDGKPISSTSLRRD